MEEIWKDVVGYENIYEVSNFGRVRTHEDKVTYTERHGVRKWKQRYLKNKTPNGRDVRVTLWKSGKSKDFLVHRLVAFAFISQIEGKNCINHIDGNPKNNHVTNLEWCNYKENQNHAFENDLAHTNIYLTLIDVKTHKTHSFISMSRASQCLNRNHGYISNTLKKGKNIVTDDKGNEFLVELN